MKIYELLKIRGVFLEIKQAQMPLKISYQIAKFLHSTDDSSTFYNEKYQSIINQYSERDENGELKLSEDGQSIKIKKETFDECVTALKELEEIDVEIPETKIDPMGLEHTGLSIEKMYILMPVLA